MEIKYQIRYLEDVVRKHIPGLPPSAKSLIRRAIGLTLLVLASRYVIASRDTGGYVLAITGLFIALKPAQIWL